MRPLLQTAAREGQATISPDGQCPRRGPEDPPRRRFPGLHGPDLFLAANHRGQELDGDPAFQARGPGSV